jgi:hypothetical protein
MTGPVPRCRSRLATTVPIPRPVLNQSLPGKAGEQECGFILTLPTLVKPPRSISERYGLGGDHENERQWPFTVSTDWRH